MKRKLNRHDVPEALSEGQVKTAEKSISAAPTFASLGLDSRLLQAVSHEKFTTPSSVQAKTIPAVLAVKDVNVRAKTGSGKTIAYVLPILHSVLAEKAAGSTPRSSNKRVEALVLVPTRELAAQVSSTFKTLTKFCAGDIRIENLSRKEDDAVIKANLAEMPDVIVATPSRAVAWAEKGDLTLGEVRVLVLDEADLLLSYGHEDDLRYLAETLPTGVQTVLVSATLRTEMDTLTALFHGRSSPVMLDFSSEEAEERPALAHYVVRTAEEDKFLLIYAVFKLQLIKGKVIVFVADVDRAYRVKLFLEKFGIRACVLNSELPVNSRLHVVEEFNRGVYDIIIAADDGDVAGSEDHHNHETDRSNDDQPGGIEHDDAASNDESTQGINHNGLKIHKAKKARRRHPQEDPEYGVSRGIDFRAVACVLNFDLPTSAKSYIHRAGRTARAGQTGMAVSFYIPHELYRKHKPTSIPQCEHDETVLQAIRKTVAYSQPASASSEANPPDTLAKASGVQEWAVDWEKLEGLRYRFADALRSVTRIAVRETRARELRQELINSEKLKRHFEENPDDLRHLRHDREVRVGRSMPHLKHVPDYLLPSGTQAALGKDVGFVSLRKDNENRIRKARQFKRIRGKLKGPRGKGLDPLRSLNVRGKAKK